MKVTGRTITGEDTTVQVDKEFEVHINQKFGSFVSSEHTKPPLMKAIVDLDRNAHPTSAAIYVGSDSAFVGRPYKNNDTSPPPIRKIFEVTEFAVAHRDDVVATGETSEEAVDG